MKSFVISFVVCLSFLLLLCTNPPSLNYSQVQNVTDSLIISHSPERIKGAGVVSIKIANKRYGGNADVEWNKNLSFHADFYSPLGTVVASISGDTVNGTFDYSEKTYTFNIDSTMDSLPFVWARDFSFHEFSELLTGNLSTIVKTFNTRPDLMYDCGHLAAANWKTDLKNYTFTTMIDRRKLFVEKVVFESVVPKRWIMTFYNFKKGIAYSMQFKDSDNNSFSLEYDHLKYFWELSKS